MINLHRYKVVKILLKCCWRTSINWTVIRLKTDGRWHPTAGIIGNIDAYTLLLYRVFTYVNILFSLTD